MAFVVETGAGLSNATSYISLADANTYWTERGSSVWSAATDAQKQAALMYATAWLDDTFRWYSYIYNTEQALGWPRGQYFDSENRTIPEATVHQKIKDATCEVAAYHLTEGLNDVSSDGVQSEKLGDASITYRAGGAQKSYSFVKVFLREYGMPSKLKNNRVWRS